MFEKITNLIISGGIFTQYRGNDTAFQQLREAIAPAALHDSGERFSPPRCHQNTRLEILKVIDGWIDSKEHNGEGNGPSFMWMRGTVGIGKSAIAQTLAEQCAREGKLLATFFFSRFDASRNRSHTLGATIAYQAALNIPDIRTSITDAISRDPLLLRHRALPSQIQSLLIRPLQERQAALNQYKSPRTPHLIILDGLDECDPDDRGTQVYLLQELSKIFTGCRLPFLILIASRPEIHLIIEFESERFTNQTTYLDLNKFFSDGDIRLFLEDKFEEIKKTHPLRAQIPPDWPGAEAISTLISKASGQFIYASTVVKYVGSDRHLPRKRLDIILGIRPPQKNDAPFAALDSLYTTIFASLEDAERVLDVLCMVILYRKHFLTPDIAEQFLSLEQGEALLALLDLSSVLIINDLSTDSTVDTEWVKLAHASVDEFLRDPLRSKEFFLDSIARHTAFTRRCFEIIGHPEPDHAAFSYAYACLPDHLSHAEFTSDIRRDILNLKISVFYNHRPDLRPANIVEVVLGYFSSTRGLAPDLSSLLHEMLYEHVSSQLITYYSDPVLTALIAVVFVVCEEGSSSSVDPFGVIFWFDYGPSAPKEKDSLQLMNAMRLERTTFFEYCKLIYPVLTDPRVPERYRLTGQRYAMSTLLMLQYVVEGIRSRPEKGSFSHHKWLLESELIPMLINKSEKTEELEAYINSSAEAKEVWREISWRKEIRSDWVVEHRGVLADTERKA